MPLDRHASAWLETRPRKILLLTGARQTGTTFLCESVLKPETTLNLDLPADRKAFRAYQTRPAGTPAGTLFVDEIHKSKGWRNLLKGYYDKNAQTRFVASGSSAFELLRGDRGDSLAGRTIPIRIEPLTFREYLLSFDGEADLPAPFDLSDGTESSLVESVARLRGQASFVGEKSGTYFRQGGFPEPLSEGTDAFLAEWLKEYMNALLSRDLRDLESAKDSERAGIPRVFVITSEPGVFEKVREGSYLLSLELFAALLW